MSVVVRRYIDILIIIITFPYSTCISSFLAAVSVYTFLFILKMFFRSCLCYFCAIEQTLLKEHWRSFKNRDHANIINLRAERAQ